MLRNAPERDAGDRLDAGKSFFRAFGGKGFSGYAVLLHLWKNLHVCSEKLAGLWDLGIVIYFVSNYNISAYAKRFPERKRFNGKFPAQRGSY